MNTFSLRLLVALFSAALLAGQNPLAMAGDPFSGTFQNDQLKLELSRKAAEYSGVILLGGQTLPVKAKVSGGKLAGTFESQGQRYSFEATRTGSQLSLTTDGVTHVLEKAAIAPAATSPVPAPTAASVVGIWRGPSGVVKINADGSAVIGDKTHRWKNEGSVITFSDNAESIRVPYELAGDTWTWKFPNGQMALNRISGDAPPTPGATGITGSWQGPSGSVQLNPDGSATVAGVMYRYALAGNQLTLTGPDGTFVATVHQTDDTMTWLINGKTLAFQRAAATWALTGGKAGGILPELIGKWCQPSNACFTLLADGSFLFAGDGGDGDSGTWTATADSLISTSKKTGKKTLRLERRNHPKSGEPMLVLDGAEFTTAFQKAPWR